jgi:hypothetical protein
MLLASQGCSSDSSNDPQPVPADLVAEDYIDQGDNILWLARAKWTVKTFDDNGNETGVDQSEANCKATIGATTQVGGFTVRPLLVYDEDGDINGGGPIGYIALFNGNLSFMTIRDYEVITALPKELKDGKTWTPYTNVHPSMQSLFKVAAHFPTFTNTAGKTYSNVLKTSHTYSDAVIWGNSKHGELHDTNFDIYFAKGIGPIEIVVNKFDYRSLSISGSEGHQLWSGTVSRTNE